MARLTPSLAIMRANQSAGACPIDAIGNFAVGMNQSLAVAEPGSSRPEKT
jgi:hypothetical protein